jgi:hypothetical protein
MQTRGLLGSAVVGFSVVGSILTLIIGMRSRRIDRRRPRSGHGGVVLIFVAGALGVATGCVTAEPSRTGPVQLAEFFADADIPEEMTMGFEMISGTIIVQTQEAGFVDDRHMESYIWMCDKLNGWLAGRGSSLGATRTEIVDSDRNLMVESDAGGPCRVRRSTRQRDVGSASRDQTIRLAVTATASAAATAAATAAVPASSNQWLPDPILDASAAISRSLNALPDGYAVTQEAARLITWATYAEWGQSVGDTKLTASTPVWLVGFRGNGMVVGEIIAAQLGITVNDTRAAVGAFYCWDATSGNLVEWGGLLTDQEYETLSELTSQTLRIAPATAYPAQPTFDPTWLPVTPIP